MGCRKHYLSVKAASPQWGREMLWLVWFPTGDGSNLVDIADVVVMQLRDLTDKGEPYLILILSAGRRAT
jgi:hypothetical protein